MSYLIPFLYHDLCGHVASDRNTGFLDVHNQVPVILGNDNDTSACHKTKIRQVLSFINEHLTEELTVEQLSERVYLSRYHFMRLFKAQTGSTVHAYVRQKRLLSAARLIREGVPAAKAAADSGFGDYSAFHRAFKECFGIAPGELKK